MVINIPIYGFNEVVEVIPCEVSLPKVIVNTTKIRTLYKCFTDTEYLAVTINHFDQSFTVQSLIHSQSGDNIENEADLLGVIWVRTRMNCKEYQDIDFTFFNEEIKRLNVLCFQILDGLAVYLDEVKP